MYVLGIVIMNLAPSIFTCSCHIDPISGIAAITSFKGGLFSPPFPVVHDQLLCLDHVEGEVVVLAPHCQFSDLLPIGCLFIVINQIYHCVVGKLYDGIGVMLGHAVVGEQSIKCIYKSLFTSTDVTKCYTETQPKTTNSKQCRCRSTVARKNSIERQEPRKKPREEPGSEGCPVLFWLCQVEIIRVHGHLRPDCSSRCLNVHR